MDLKLTFRLRVLQYVQIRNRINSSIETELAAKAKQCEEGKEFKLVQVRL